MNGRIGFRYIEDDEEGIEEYDASTVTEAVGMWVKEHGDEPITGMVVVDKNWKGER